MLCLGYLFSRMPTSPYLAILFYFIYVFLHYWGFNPGLWYMLSKCFIMELYNPNPQLLPISRNLLELSAWLGKSQHAHPKRDFKECGTFSVINNWNPCWHLWDGTEVPNILPCSRLSKYKRDCSIQNDNIAVIENLVFHLDSRSEDW